MAGKALHVKKTQEIRRLIDLGLSQRQIANALKIHRTTVKKYLEEKPSENGDIVSSTLIPDGTEPMPKRASCGLSR